MMYRPDIDKIQTCAYQVVIWIVYQQNRIYDYPSLPLIQR